MTKRRSVGGVNACKLMIVLGTRPEAIKLAPVLSALRMAPDVFQVRLCSTGQHREMLHQAFRTFGMVPDMDLKVMCPQQTLAGLTAALFTALDGVLASECPDWVIVQGDTTTAMVGAVAAFYRGIKVAHVEAGLRTYDRLAPFPEETNRTFIGHVTELHFAPTERAAANLRKEGVPADRIHVTGNTGADALQWVREQVRKTRPSDVPTALVSALEGRRMILVTGHRRESIGEGFENVCRALREIARRHEDVIVVYPVHPNPSVSGPVHRMLGDEARIYLTGPLPYETLVYLMDRSHLILTDSGGIQEEAPSLGKPVLVTRDTTERLEGIEAGVARLVGTRYESIVAAVAELLTDEAAYVKMARATNPYGDGHAAQRIVDVLARLVKKE